MKDSRDGDDAIRQLDGYEHLAVHPEHTSDSGEIMPNQATVLCDVVQHAIWQAQTSIESRMGKGK